jgi:RNA polymerase sigma factor (sigma-70 family)
MRIRIDYFVREFNYSHQFLNKIEPQIVQMAKNYLIPGQATEDIAQELRLHIWSKLPLYDPKKGKVKNWAYVVCRNKLADMQTKSHSQKTRKKQDLLDIGSTRLKPLEE